MKLQGEQGEMPAPPRPGMPAFAVPVAGPPIGVVPSASQAVEGCPGDTVPKLTAPLPPPPPPAMNPGSNR